MKKIIILLNILACSLGYSSVDKLHALYTVTTKKQRKDYTYHKDMATHRKAFLDCIKKHKIGSYFDFDRVTHGVGCTDCDYIPKCKDAGKVMDFNGQSIQLMHNGIKVIEGCYCGDWVTDLIYGLKGHHEPQEEKVFYEILKYIPKNSTMLELGSYWAYYSLWFANTVPGAKNYMIEPDPERLAIGKKNFKLNNKKGNFFRGYIVGRGVDAGNAEGAPKILIDTFLEKHGIDHLSILHSDIQGYEYQMLLSAERSIRDRKVDYCVISTHGAAVHKDCRDFLLEHDYDILAEHTGGESYSVDGLIVGRRKELPGCGPIQISKSH